MDIKQKETVMYSQLQPWSTVGAPPLMEQVAGPPIPTRIGTYYQTPRPHPWRPTMGYEMIEVTPVPEQPITNKLCNPCYTPSGMSTEPLRFPNLVTGFERNPQHGARAALYTRYTEDEWRNGCLSAYDDADKNRKYAERIRGDIVATLRETDEKTVNGQYDGGRRIGERITDVTFWRNELNTELERLVTQTGKLADLKRNVTKAQQDLEACIHITTECLYHREGRKGIEKTHDNVEQSLLIETDNLRKSLKELKNIHDKISKQISDSRAIQHAIEEDVVSKESAIGIDSVCHQLNNFSRGINYYGGIENYDPTVSTAETWSQASCNKVLKSQVERENIEQLCITTNALINGIAISVWDCWSNTNNALDKRASEMLDAKSKVQNHLEKVQNEIFAIEHHIDLLRKSIQDKSDPLKVAQTRLEARTHRASLELCKDAAQLQLVKEVIDIQNSIKLLHNKIQNAEAQHQQLLKTRSNLESDLKNKADALFIDREKCMGLRRSFPVKSLIKY